MAANDLTWNLLAKAAQKLGPRNFDEYFELRRLLASRHPADRHEFRTRFAKYYKLNSAGLTEAFKRRYFQLLFAFRPPGPKDPYTTLLRTLYQFPRLQGDQCLQVVFVSKLVAIHDESRPLFDSNVSEFFGMSRPEVGSIRFQIAGFVENLLRIQKEYESWAQDPHFHRIVKPLIRKHPKLGTCHSTRLCDFLVWTVGAYELK